MRTPVRVIYEEHIFHGRCKPSHFVINSVSFKTGKKLHEPPNTLLKLRKYSDQICQQYGLTTLAPYLGGKSQNPGVREYRSAAKGESWKFALMSTIDHAMKIRRNKEDFIKSMERKGYSVKWTDTTGCERDIRDIDGVVGSVVPLGKAVERLGNDAPVKDSTTKPVVKEHKKGVGQKKDDHSGYDFEMKM